MENKEKPGASDLKRPVGANTARKLMLAAGAVGAAGGAVRGVQLIRCFDSEALPVGGNGLNISVWAIAAVQIAAAAAVWFWLGKRGGAVSQKGRKFSEKGGIVCAVLLGLASAVCFAMSYSPFSLWGIVLGAVCFAAAAAMPSVLRGVNLGGGGAERAKLASLLPVAAMALQLVEFYRRVSKNPTASWYASDAFACAVLVLLLFSFAGVVNGRTGVKKVLTMSFAFVSMGLTALIGRAAYLVSEIAGGAGAGVLVSDAGLECALFVFGTAAAVSAVRAAYSEKPANDKPDEEIR